MFGKTQFDVKQSRHGRYIKLPGDSSTADPLVLLHGMFGGLSNFDPLLNRLGHRTVFVPEIPIYEFDKSRLNIPDLAEWLQHQLDVHNIENPVLLGNSMGGHIALQHALSFPDRAQALVLTGSSGLFEDDLGTGCPRRYDREFIKERASLTFYDDLVDDVIVDEILDVLKSPKKLGRLLRIARSTHEDNLSNQLEAIAQPVLLVWGRDDVITPPRVAEQFKAELPNARLRWIEKCGHAPMMERPDRFYEFLEEFLISIKQPLNKTSIQRYEDYSHI